MKIKITSIIFLLLFVITARKAQGQVQDSIPNTLKVYSVNLTTSWYQPKMDYWNDTYLPSLGVTENFGGNLFWGGDITFSLPANLRGRAGMSYWSDKVEGDENSAISSLKIAFTRFRLGAFYAPKAVSVKGIQPYLGIEGQFYLIKNKLDNGAVTTEQQGQDYSFAPVVGIDRSFGHVNLGLEFMYNIGSYTQDVTDGIGVAEQKVSITGPEVVVSVGYRF